ncbi:MAG: hypothetical protein EOP05_04520 [Proteobacteria bacterium]|nr:MAG: hypothetical protein EOP05_04520 [Pseudomonadota bacterium]
MKTPFASVLLSALTGLTVLASVSTGHAQTNPNAKVWSDTIKCTLSSMEYYDFSKADPYVSIYPGLGGRDPKIEILLKTGENKDAKGSMKVPGTNFQIDIDKLTFTNRIGGVPTEFKSLRVRTILRQDGEVIASAENDGRGADTHAFVTTTHRMTPNLSVEADLCTFASYKTPVHKNMATCFQELAPQQQIVIAEANVICFASKEEWKKK